MRAAKAMRFMLGAVIAAGSACGPAPAPAPAQAPLERHEYSRALMGMEARVVLYAPGEEAARAGAEAAFRRLAELDEMFSDWKETSELSALSRAAGGGERRVSKDLGAVLLASSEIAAGSHGAFDPTVGPVVLLWREARKRRELPDAGALARARALVDYRAVEVAFAEGGATVRLAKPGMRLDLGGIAKGYAAQEAVRALAARGLPRALVAIAGDVVCGEAPPGREGWEVALGRTGATLTVAEGAVSTSGDAEQFVEVGGVRYSHIVDPRTGLGLVGAPEVTVRAHDGATADALATAVCVLGDGPAARELVGRFPGAEIVRIAK